MHFLEFLLTWYFCSVLFCSVFLWQKGKVIYHQTMTPTWLKAHASYVDISLASAVKRVKQLTFNAGVLDNAALLKVPMIPTGFLKVDTPLTLEITVAHDISIGNTADRARMSC